MGHSLVEPPERTVVLGSVTIYATRRWVQVNHQPRGMLFRSSAVYTAAQGWIHEGAQCDLSTMVQRGLMLAKQVGWLPPETKLYQGPHDQHHEAGRRLPPGHGC